MGRTLLIGTPRTTWREWLRSNLGNRELLVLDPGDPEHDHLGRVVWFRQHRPIYTRFMGTLDAQRVPHLLIGAVGAVHGRLHEDAVIQAFPDRGTPLMRQTVGTIIELLRPERVLAAVGVATPYAHETIELAPALSPAVIIAQRKAQWMKLMEECESHEVYLRDVIVEGARLLTGTSLSTAERELAALGGTLHAERQSGTLFVVSEEELDADQVGRALDVTGCSKAVFANPSAYFGLMCSFARNGGEDFGTGFVSDIDWDEMRATISSTAVAPAPIQALRLGTIRVDPSGNELGEVRPWQI